MKQLYSLALRLGYSSRSFLYMGSLLLLGLLPTAALAANPVLRIEALGSATGSSDVTIFVDQVEIIQVSTSAAVPGAVTNASFETSGTLVNGDFGYNPSGATWAFNGRSGIARNGSAFNAPAAPNGIAVAFVQSESGTNGVLQQTLALGAGTYQVRFRLSQRDCCSTGARNQRLNVLIGGASVGTATSSNLTDYDTFTSASFAVDPPTLTAVAPTPGGLGQSITLTGTNLASATALTINGADAFANIISNTATSVVVRVPVTAAATGSVSISTAAGTATRAFTVMAPPGNALAFDGVNDYVALPSSTPVPLGNAAYTVEAWVNPNSMTLGSILGWGNYGTTNQANGLSLNTAGLINYWWGNDLQVATPSLVGRWHHVAATYDGTTRRLYLNGVAVGADVPGVHAVPNAQNLRIGSNSNGGFTYLNGRLDEVRVYSVALTPAQLQADMTSTAAAVPASLVLYYNFDQGTPATASAGANTGLTTLYSLGNNATPGTLTGFALASGNTTSNYVESYALVVPTATAATAVEATGFTANWTAPAVGTVDNGYRLDVSTSATFASVITGSPFTVSTGTSRALTGLAPSTTYYYRVRADKTSVTGQGAYSNTVSVTTCALVTAVAQNVTVNLDASGNATVAATAVNNGSTVNCAPAAASTLSLTDNTNRLVNGTFDTNATGWTPTNVDGNGGYRNTGGNPGGLFILNDNGKVESDPTLSQTVTGLVSGATYVLRGDYRNYYSTGPLGAPALAVDLNGTQLTTFPAVGTTWTPFSLTFTATGTSQTLGFRGEINSTDVDIAIDNLRLNQTGSTLAFTCANTGANLVTLTVTDGSGNTASQTATVTVVDNTAPVAYVLPPAPALATTNVPEAAGYGVLFQLDMPNVASFNALASVPYTVNNSGLALAKPARVAYFMELTNTSGVSKWVWASMDNFATTLAQLGLPNPTANNVVWNQNVTGLNVFASANAGLTTGSNVGTGRLEMWRFNYSANNASNVPGASSSLYDFGDQSANANNYGSFQVHNVTAGQTLLAYNNWGGERSGSGIGDLGIGNQVGGSGHPDWTFAYNANTYTVKKVYVLVTKTETSATASFTQPATVALDVNGNAAVTPALVYNGNAIDNCGSVTATVSPANLTCANVGANTVTVTLTDGNGNAISQTAVVTVTAPPTPTTTWNGNASTIWTDCANWSFGKVPDAATSVVIPTGQPRYPVVTAGTNPVLNLTVNTGGTLTLNGGATLQVNGNFANNGTATLSGTVAFVGSAATQTLNNGGGFNTVTVNKPSGTVQLAQNLTINSALTLTAGTLTTTSSYQVNLGGSAGISESETSYVIGKAVVNRTLAAGTAEPFAGLGLTLTPAAGSTAPGATLVTRVTGTPLTGVGTSVSVQRYFDIQPAVKTGLNVTMDFAYFNHELNGIPAANLALFKSVSSLTGPWANQSPVTLGTKTVNKTGITEFSIWTLGNTANPLPVELTAFTATPQGNATVRLAWATASEKNSARFDVERSLDGSRYVAIGTVAAAGNSSSARAYELLDAKLPATVAMFYYRLQQVDVDGTTSYSPVRTVMLSGKAAGGLVLAPNPARATTLTGAVAGAPVTVFDAVGRVVLTATANATGAAQLVLPAYLPTGVYVVRTGTKAVRLVVE